MVSKWIFRSPGDLLFDDNYFEKIDFLLILLRFSYKTFEATILGSHPRHNKHIVKMQPAHSEDIPIFREIFNQCE